MPSLINVEDLTLNPQEVTEVSQIMWERVIESPTIADIHDVIEGIKYKTQILFGGIMGDSLKVSVGCTPNPANGLELTEDFWDPIRYDARWEHCQADVNALFKLLKNYQKMNPDFYNRIDSEEMGILIAKIEQALPLDIMAKVWFNDSDAALIADGGNFTAGTDLALYNGNDGIWKQVFTKIVPGDENYVEITANAGATYADQKITPADAAEVLEAMYFAADPRLKDDPDARILVTSSIFDGYLQYLKNTQATGGGFTAILENGQPALSIYGIPVVKMPLWDRKIKSLFDNGTKYDKPNRALMTTKYNIPIGTVSEQDFTSIDSFYEKYKKINVLDAVVEFDAKFLQRYLGVAAY